MSRKKKRWSRENWKAPATGARVVTPDNLPPLRGVVGTQPGALEEARERWRAEGRKEIAQDVDAKIDQVRADARALETAARILDDTPPMPREQTEQVKAALFAMAAGMRLAVDRMPYSDDIPF